ncbi:hypothetical protein D9M70_491420 [compost metagenome]
MDALAGALPRRAHGVVGIVVEAGAVAVAVHRRLVALAHLNADLAVVLATGRHFIDLQQFGAIDQRRGDLARIELVARVEGALDALQLRIEVAEEFRRVLRAHALAVLAPEQPLVLLRQPYHLVGDFSDQPLLRRVLHVDRRTYMQHAGIDVAEHAVLKPARVQHRTEFHDEVRQVLRWHRGIFDEGNRPALALGVAQQPHRLLAHAPDLVDLGGTIGHGVAEAATRLAADRL